MRGCEVRRIIRSAPGDGHDVVDGIGRTLPADVAHAIVRAHHHLAMPLVPPRAPYPWSGHVPSPRYAFTDNTLTVEHGTDICSGYSSPHSATALEASKPRMPVASSISLVNPALSITSAKSTAATPAA